MILMADQVTFFHMKRGPTERYFSKDLIKQLQWHKLLMYVQTLSKFLYEK